MFVDRNIVSCGNHFFPLLFSFFLFVEYHNIGQRFHTGEAKCVGPSIRKGVRRFEFAAIKLSAREKEKEHDTTIF